MLLELSNPEVELAALDAVSQLRGAEAQLAELRVRLESQRLNQEADLARVESEYRQAQLKADTDAVLAKQGLVADLNRQISALAAEEMGKRETVERKRLSISGDSIRAQLAVQQAAVEQRRALARLRQSQLEALKVRAGLDGMLQLVPVEVGQQVTPGTNLARVSQPEKLKAVLRIPETQAQDVQIGQRGLDRHAQRRRRRARGPHRPRGAERHGHGRRRRSTGALPRGARPDLSVDGTIELERLANVLYVGPAGAGAAGDRDRPLPSRRPGTNEAQRRAGAARAGVGQHDRGALGPRGGRPGRSCRTCRRGTPSTACGSSRAPRAAQGERPWWKERQR